MPRDAIVDVEGLHTGWKDLRYKPRRQGSLPTGPGGLGGPGAPGGLAGPGGPKIRVSGAVGFGRLKIRHARR